MLWLHNEGEKGMAEAGGKRGARSDARRNHEQLLKTTSALFREKGVMVPMKDIAREAGIGVGTLYRHFPHRADLIAAVFRNEVDECATAAAGDLAQTQRLVNLFLKGLRYNEANPGDE